MVPPELEHAVCARHTVRVGPSGCRQGWYPLYPAGEHRDGVTGRRGLNVVNFVRRRYRSVGAVYLPFFCGFAVCGPVPVLLLRRRIRSTAVHPDALRVISRHHVDNTRAHVAILGVEARRQDLHFLHRGNRNAGRIVPRDTIIGHHVAVQHELRFLGEAASEIAARFRRNRPGERGHVRQRNHVFRRQGGSAARNVKLNHFARRNNGQRFHFNRGRHKLKIGRRGTININNHSLPRNGSVTQ